MAGGCSSVSVLLGMDPPGWEEYLAIVLRVSYVSCIWLCFQCDLDVFYLEVCPEKVFICAFENGAYSFISTLQGKQFLESGSLEHCMDPGTWVVRPGYPLQRACFSGFGGDVYVVPLIVWWWGAMHVSVVDDLSHL